MGATPRILGNRYALTERPRVGGMSKVFAASDITQPGNKVAIKLFERGSLDDEIICEAFNRELRALKELQHPAVVQLLDHGIEENTGRPFLVLEWCDSDLSRYAESTEGWDTFFQDFGRPILDALAFAHSRQLAHRDVKPANILIDSSGQPKLTDFSISKLKTWLEPGITLGEFRSVPFSPPETDDGSFSYTRDVYGFAVVVLDCMSDIRLINYEDLPKALDDINVPSEIHGLLSKSLSKDPQQRPRDARVLLAQFDKIQSNRTSGWQQFEPIHLELPSSALSKLRGDFPSDSRDEIQSRLADDLNSVCGIRPYLQQGQRVDGHYQLLGGRYSCHVATGRHFPLFVIHGVRLLSPGLLERQREDSLLTQHRFTFNHVSDEVRAKRILLELQEQVEINQQELRAKAAEKKEQELFGTWLAILRAKTDLEKRKEQPIKYRGFKVKGNRIAFDLVEPVEEQIIGQQRLVKEEKTIFVTGEVDQVSTDSLTLYVSNRFSSDLPQHGRLLVDTSASRVAIERQKAALDSIRFDRAARSDVRTLVIHPEKNAIPQEAESLTFFHSDLDEAKKAAIAKALGADGFLVVEGPPGTGKTTFIAELILQVLREMPAARILLSSQTHVALDNALERINSKQCSIRMVRIGRSDNPRIAPEVSGLLLENQIDSWRDEALKKGHVFLEEHARKNGFSLEQLRVGELLNRLSLLSKELNTLDDEIARREKEIEDFLEANPLLAEPASRPGVRGSEELAQMEEDIEKSKTERKAKEKNRKTLCDELRKDEIAKEVADFTPDEIASWSSAFLQDDSPAGRTTRELLNIQVEWSARFGRSSDFHPALVSVCQVIAGTCVGIAGIRGLQDLEFDLCIVDEASKATPTETLVPISRSHRWILVGDKRQLPPFVEEGLLDDQLLQGYGLSQENLTATLFDRLCAMLPDPCRTSLYTQHRMVPAIGNLISQCFYDGELRSAQKQQDSTLSTILPKPVTWLSTSGRINRHQVQCNTSFTNPCEAQLIADLLRRMEFLAAANSRRYRVAVLTGYAEQRRVLERSYAPFVLQNPHLQVEWNTIDAFQGREADVAIYSVTRSNPEGKLGFLKESARLNVALSRGRQYLILVGDIQFAREARGQNPFRKVVEHIEQNPQECCIKELR